jgi:acyl transferase domain-containing protein
MLLAMCKGSLPDEDTRIWLPSLRKERNAWEQMLESLAALYVHGVEVDWSKFDRDYPRRRLPLPTYAFQRRRYWAQVDTRSGAKTGEPVSMWQARTDKVHPLLGYRLHSPALKDFVFETQIGADLPTFLEDHRIFGTVVFPLTAYVEMALAGARDVLGTGTCVLEDMVISEALVLPKGETQTMHFVGSITRL